VLYVWAVPSLSHPHTTAGVSMIPRHYARPRTEFSGALKNIVSE
jgi:hypothetical protein